MHLECGNAEESYFFCKRGRKYKNSVRPNRVTGSGFWEGNWGSTGPIYSLGGQEEKVMNALDSRNHWYTIVGKLGRAQRLIGCCMNIVFRMIMIVIVIGSVADVSMLNSPIKKL